ncbi:MAG: GAF domain-containing protein, partial [candidate division KSB1 bacterium]|nr:GAF domain-containing protein [candidate division KSB1 bacterium]
MNSLDQSQISSSTSSFEHQLDDKLMELQALFDISKTLSASLNLKFILDNILLTPMGKMMISKGLVLLHKGNGIFVVETLKGLPRNLIGKHIEIRTSLLLPTFTSELTEEENGWCDFFKQFGIVLLLPLVSNNRNLGLIGFGTKILGTDYTPSELDFLNSLSNIAATSVENGLIFRELNDVNRKLDKKIQELNTLFDIGKELNATLDSDKIVNLLAYAIMGEMMVNRCLVFLKKNDAMELTVTKGIARVEDELKKLREEKFLRHLCQLYHPINLDMESVPNELRPFNEAGFKIVVPMRVQDETKGIIAIGDKINRQSFREDELEFLYTLGNQAMISLENARLFEETLEKQRLE